MAECDPEYRMERQFRTFKVEMRKDCRIQEDSIDWHEIELEMVVR